MSMPLEIFVEIVLIWDFHVTFFLANTPENLAPISHSTVVPSMKSSEKFCSHETRFRGGMKDNPFNFITIN